MKEYNPLLTAEESADNIQVFNNRAFGSVRVVVIDNNPWFIAKDVCDCLGLGNSRQAIANLRDKDKGVISNDTLGGKQEMTTISESGFYELVLSSRKPEAKQFKYWVVDDVLPAIRNTGAYMTPATAAQVVDDPFYAVKLAEKTLAQYTQAINAWKQAVENLEAEKQMHQNTKEHLALTEQQRDEAIRTKACISDKKTATAMATASAAVRKTASLENKLGEGATWKTVAAIPWLKTVFPGKNVPTNRIGSDLSKLSHKFGYPVKDAPDARWGKVNRYHIDIINRFHDILMNNESLYREFR